MSEWIPQVFQVPRHRIRSRRTNGKCFCKKLVATTVSSRQVRQRRREEGKATSSHICTETQGNHRNDKSKSEGGGKQSWNTRTATFHFAWDVKAVTMKLKRVKTKIRKEEEEADSIFETLTVTCHWVCEALMKNTKQQQQKKQQKTRRWAEAMIRAAGKKTAEAERQAVAKICAATIQSRKNKESGKTKEKDTHHLHRARKTWDQCIQLKESKKLFGSSKVTDGMQYH